MTMDKTRIIHWEEGEPQPGDTHREYGRTWVYIPMPYGSPVPGVWKSIGGSGGGGGGGGGTVWWHEIQNKPESYPPEEHNHIGTDILIDTNEDGDYSDAPDLETVLKEFRDKVERHDGSDDLWRIICGQHWALPAPVRPR